MQGKRVEFSLQRPEIRIGTALQGLTTSPTPPRGFIADAIISSLAIQTTHSSQVPAPHFMKIKVKKNEARAAAKGEGVKESQLCATPGKSFEQESATRASAV